MALICMAVHDTEENGRAEFTNKTMWSLFSTVDLSVHRLIIINNNSCKKTTEYIDEVMGHLPAVYNHRKHITPKVINLSENTGTARAINLALKDRMPGEHAIKMDNDIEIKSDDWVDEMEAAINREPQIGICGLKRKDLWQYPGHPEKQYRSELIMLPHKPGERWIIAERTKDVMGTCVMFNSALLDKIGYLYQPSLYGYDDVLACYRSELAGFINVFLPHVEMDHIDPGGTEYCEWKRVEAARNSQEIIRIVDQYIAGTRSIYEEA